MRCTKFARMGLHLVLLLVLVAHMGCGACRPRVCQEDVHRELGFTDPCVTGVRRSSHEVYLSTDRRCPWESLVNLDVFAGFRPGMTAKEAQRLIGPAWKMEKGSAGDFWKYQRPEGIVTVSHEDQGASLFIDYWWLLSAEPRSSSPNRLLAKEVLEHIPKDQEHSDIVILNGCGFPMVSIQIVKGEVRRIDWIQNPGSWRPPTERAQFLGKKN